MLEIKAHLGLEKKKKHAKQHFKWMHLFNLFAADIFIYMV